MAFHLPSVKSYSQSWMLQPELYLEGCKCMHITSVLQYNLHWLKYPFRMDFNVCTLVYKALHGTISLYVSELCVFDNWCGQHSWLWSAADDKLMMPRTHQVQQECRACFLYRRSHGLEQFTKWYQKSNLKVWSLHLKHTILPYHFHLDVIDLLALFRYCSFILYYHVYYISLYIIFYIGTFSFLYSPHKTKDLCVFSGVDVQRWPVESGVIGDGRERVKG